MKHDNTHISSQDLQGDDRIESFLRGEMSASEEAAFKSELHSDEQMRSHAVASAHLVKAMSHVGQAHDTDVKEAWGAIGRDEARSIAARPLAQRRHVAWMRVLSIAASILVLVVVGYRYNDYRVTTGLGRDYATAFVTESTALRGAENTAAATQLNRLFASVQRGTDLDATISRLSVLWQVASLSTYNDYTDYASLIGWNLAIAQLKNNDRAQARATLTRLAAATDNAAIRAKSTELLKKLQ